MMMDLVKDHSCIWLFLCDFAYARTLFPAPAAERSDSHTPAKKGRSTHDSLYTIA